MEYGRVAKRDRLYRFFYNLVMPRNQVIILTIVFATVAIFSYISIISFRPFERPAPLKSLTPQKIAEWGVMPPRVSIGLDILDFPVIDFVNNQFVFDGIIWFEFDPALLALDTVGKFSFEKGEILQKSEPNTQLVDSKLFARYDIRVRFTSDLEYDMFPFDDHTIFITVVNRTISPVEMVFRSYSSFFKLSSSIAITGWDIKTTAVRTGYSESHLDTYDTSKVISHPKAVFSIGFRRGAIRNSLIILLPMLLIFFLALFSLSFDPEKQMTIIMSLATLGVTSLLAYRFVIENMTPRVGYFVFSDQIFILILAATLIIFMFDIGEVSTGRLTRFLVISRGILFIVVNVIIVLAWYYFLLHL